MKNDDSNCEVFKALACETRLQMLAWLKHPAKHFRMESPESKEHGVCVGELQRKAGLSPSTASAHLAILQRAGLVQTTRVGQWTYYRRDDGAISKFAEQIQKDL